MPNNNASDIRNTVTWFAKVYHAHITFGEEHTFMKLIYADRPVTDLVLTRSNIQAGFVSYTHGRHLVQPHGSVTKGLPPEQL